MTSGVRTIRVALISAGRTGEASSLHTRLARNPGFAVEKQSFPVDPATLRVVQAVVLVLSSAPRPLLEVGRSLSREHGLCVLAALPEAGVESAVLEDATAHLMWRPDAWIDASGSDLAMVETLRLVCSTRTLTGVPDQVYRQIVESMDDIVFTLDTEHRLTGVHGRWLERFGVGSAMFIGRTISEVLEENEPEVHERAITEALQGRQISYDWSLSRDGTELHFQTLLSPIRDGSGQVTGLVGVGRDTSALVEARSIIDERDRRFRSLASQIPGTIYQYQMFPDGRSCFPFATEQIREIYEVTPEEIREDAGAVFARLHPDDFDAVSASIMASYESLTVWTDDYRVCLPERGVRWLRGRATPERLADGSVLWHGHIMDITDLKRIEQERTTLYNELTHRVKNNIAMVASLVRMKAADMGDTGELDDLEHRVRTIATMHDHLAGAADTGQVILQAYLEQVIDGVTAGFPRGVAVHVDAEGLSLASREATALGLVVNELATNAAKYGFGEDAEPVFSCSMETEGEVVRVRVSNSGAPFPDDLDIAQGPGLGLQLVHLLVEQLEGRVELESRAPTTFRISIPRQVFQAAI